MAEKLTELKGGKNNVLLGGKLHIKADDGSFGIDIKSKNASSNWIYSTMNIGVETGEGNVIYAGAMGGHSTLKDKAVVYTMTSDFEAIQVNWKDRFNDNIIATVNKMHLYRAGLEVDENNKIIYKEFISEKDFIEYCKEHMVDGMEVSVVGEYEFQEYEGEVRKSIKVRSVRLLRDRKVRRVINKEKVEVEVPVAEQYMARAVITTLLEEDTFNGISAKNKEDGEIVLPLQVPQYVGKQNGKQIKKTLPFVFPVTAKLTGDKSELILEKLFTKVSKGAVTEITLVVDIVEGYEQAEFDINNMEIEEDLQELIDLGVMSLDEVAEQAMVRGNRTSKIVFVKPATTKDDDGSVRLDIEVDKYDASVMFEEDEEEISNENDDADDDDADTDESWMDDLMG